VTAGSRVVTAVAATAVAVLAAAAKAVVVKGRPLEEIRVAQEETGARAVVGLVAAR
jgi:hypothetical protein